jgi:hypothetical protein
MIQAKITKYLGINPENGKAQYVIEVPTDEKEYNYNPSIDVVHVCHDFVEIESNTVIAMTYDSQGNYPEIPKGVAGCGSNNLVLRTSVQVDIRTMIDIILPYFNNHKYLQQEHIGNRIHDEDDEYFEHYGLTKPRYKKGDLYPAYTYSAAIVSMGGEFYLRRKESTEVEKMSATSFNQVKDSLQLYKAAYEIK